MMSSIKFNFIIPTASLVLTKWKQGTGMALRRKETLVKCQVLKMQKYLVVHETFN